MALKRREGKGSVVVRARSLCCLPLKRHLCWQWSGSWASGPPLRHCLGWQHLKIHGTLQSGSKVLIGSAAGRDNRLLPTFLNGITWVSSSQGPGLQSSLQGHSESTNQLFHPEVQAMVWCCLAIWKVNHWLSLEAAPLKAIGKSETLGTLAIRISHSRSNNPHCAVSSSLSPHPSFPLLLYYFSTARQLCKWLLHPYSEHTF